MIALPDYAKIKDNYCISYFGYNKEYLTQLRLLRPQMEQAFPGIKVYLCCRDDLFYLFHGEPRTLVKSKLFAEKNQFAYVREISYTEGEHPIEQLFIESDLKIKPICTSSSNYGPANLLTNGVYPINSLNHKQIQFSLEYIASKNCICQINKDWNNFEWIVGVENELLYEAASAGKKVTLISNGIGENIFKMMFPKAEILNIPL